MFHVKHLIEAYDSRRSFDHNKAVTEITITVETGEISRLVGPNGAGKTTPINLLDIGVLTGTSMILLAISAWVLRRQPVVLATI